VDVQLEQAAHPRFAATLTMRRITVSGDKPFTIRPLQTQDELRACEEIQRLAWDTDDLQVVPAHMLLTIAKSDGLLLGAFARERPPASEVMVGFALGLLARGEPPGNTLRHHSHMLGVHPDWWGHGIGYHLKLAQREAALAQGLELMTWTFCPLERRNATLNFVKLGTVCNTYLVNLYGNLDDGLNEGLPSDRFQVDWWLYSPRVQRRLAGERPQGSEIVQQALPVVNPATMGRDEFPRPAESHPAALGAEQFLVEVAANFQGIKRKDLALARAWRMTTREIFQTAFAQGYSATEYLYHAGRSYYLLKNSQAEPQP
jgi:predicted GNAT superfamily acetyltransferase